MKPRPDHAARMQALGQSLRTGNAVRVVGAPQLFPTPPAVAARMVSFADLRAGQRILEPSAGTGNIMRAIGHARVDVASAVAFEISHALAESLHAQFLTWSVICADFLDCVAATEKFDRILMNPPFERGSDIEHILHARRLLKPDGKLVAICANGPRQATKLQPLCDHWEDLPAGTFDATGVRTALLVMGAA